jgi:hypothetical protein
MLRPRTHTDPAKVPFATLTGHMVASLIFLYWFPTIFTWTRFCVGQKPSHIFTFGSIFVFPFFSIFAIDRLVRQFSTINAELCPTFTFYGVLNCSIFLEKDAIIAPQLRTPFDVFTLVSEGFTKPFPINVCCFLIVVFS